MSQTGTPLEERLERIEMHAAPRALLWVVLGVMLILVLWASFTHIDRVTRAGGRIIPASELQIVSNLEGGIVSQLLVKSGDTVRAGQPLVQLDATQAGADFGRGEVGLASLSLKIARLEAEARGAEPRWPKSEVPEMQDLLVVERQIHRSRVAEIAALTSASNAQVRAAQQGVTEARSAADTRSGVSKYSGAQVDLLRPLVERGVEPKLALMQAESSAASAAGDAATAQATVAKLQAALALARSQRDQAISDWRARAGQELAEAQATYASQMRLQAATGDKVRRTTLTAPVDGTVNRVLVATPGGSVSPGQPLVEIVPARDTLVVEAQVRPEDIGFISLGQRATVKITAYDSAIYGSIPGKVTRISADAVSDQKDENSHYLVRVLTARPALTDRGGNNLPVGPGMRAEVSLLSGKRTVMSYLLTPITRLGEEAFRDR